VTIITIRQSHQADLCASGPKNQVALRDGLPVGL
jgi:hypothetical protein